MSWAGVTERRIATNGIELNIAEAFFIRANRRIRGNFKAIDRNDDDNMKFIAAQASELGGYPFDSPLE